MHSNIERTGGVKASKGSVGIESFQGRLRLRLPRQLYDGKQKYLSLGLPDTDTNRQLAEAKAQLIESDIRVERFDYTLVKYGQPLPPTLIVIESIKPKANFDLAELWQRYTEFRASEVSETTLRLNYARVASHINKLPTKSLADAIAIRDHLTKNHSPYTAKRILVQLSACCKWARKSRMISENPFAELLEDIKVKSSSRELKDIDPFSREEMQVIIKAFEDHPHYNYYTPFVKFLFWTGCRTSEAVGLLWKHISSDWRHINFCEAVVNVSSVGIRKKTKSEKSRKFPVSSRLAELLKSIQPEECTPETPVFTSITGKLINAHTFNADVWKGCNRHGKYVEGIVSRLARECKIDHYRPQYQTRHTFISLVLESTDANGNKPDVKDVARWVGNSPEVIYKHYAGRKADLQVPEF